MARRWRARAESRQGDGAGMTPAKLVAAVNFLATEDKYSVIPAPALPPKPADLSSPPEITVLSPGASGLQDIPHRLYLASAALFGYVALNERETVTA